jgi:hypothetical protein
VMLIFTILRNLKAVQEGFGGSHCCSVGIYAFARERSFYPLNLILCHCLCIFIVILIISTHFMVFLNLHCKVQNLEI